jgi:hypothetical protein
LQCGLVLSERIRSRKGEAVVTFSFYKSQPNQRFQPTAAPTLRYGAVPSLRYGAVPSLRSASAEARRWTSIDESFGSIEMKKIAFLAFAAAILSGCSQEQQQLTFEMPPDINPQIKQVVEVAWPKMLAACPGLNRYASDLSFAGVEDNLAYAPDDAKRIEVKFRVAESPTRIPVSYRAFGHMCYFGVTPDGKKLTISKSPCASICASSEVSTTGNYEKPL